MVELTFKFTQPDLSLILNHSALHIYIYEIRKYIYRIYIGCKIGIMLYILVI